MEYKDYYRIMGLERTASQDEIKRAYRKLAREYHPDVSKEPDAEARFKEVGEAYEVLKDPEKRAAYDQLGAGWQAGQDFRPPPGWDAGFEYRGGEQEDFDAAGFSDFFESLFGRDFHKAGGARRHDFGLRGEDHHARVLIDIEDAYQGGRRTVSLRSPVVDGHGQIQMQERHLNVRIPRGIGQGQKIRLAGQGAPGQGSGPAGDLYLEIEFRPHPLYQVRQHDVYLELPVTPWEVALGARIRVPTPTGPVELNLPAGTSGGGKLRLRGKGIPAEPAGDIYVIPKIVLPPADTDQARESYRRMRSEFSFNPRAHLGV